LQLQVVAPPPNAPLARALPVLALGRTRHQVYRVVTDFQGPLSGPVTNGKGDWVYSPIRDQDEAIIPMAAIRRRDAILKAGYRITQEIIGHEIVAMPEGQITPSRPKLDIPWGKMAKGAGAGLLLGVAGVAVAPILAFATIAMAPLILMGGLLLVDPSYCVCLPGGVVVELIRWNTEVKWNRSAREPFGSSQG
jgi:hypothetical protein